MSEFYKMNPLAWDRGTDDLTLEQEAAYLRVCNAIYAADQPIRANMRVLAGMWRCNERRAKRLLSELVAAEKLAVEDGWIVNERALDDVSKRRALRVERASAGRLGGIESGKSRSKVLQNNEITEAIGSTRKEEEIEEEKNDLRASEVVHFSPPQTQQFEVSTDAAIDAASAEFWAAYPRKENRTKAQAEFIAACFSASPALIVAGAKRFAETHAGQESRYLPLPATWLRDKRWLDEPVDPPPKAKTAADKFRKIAAQYS
jgi:uncharacterized protein YdaU (DUF1376 family)